MIFGTQYDHSDIATMSGHAPDPPLTEPTVINGVLYGMANDETLDMAEFGVTEVHAGYGDDTGAVVFRTKSKVSPAGQIAENVMFGSDGKLKERVVYAHDKADFKTVLGKSPSFDEEIRKIIFSRR